MGSAEKSCPNVFSYHVYEPSNAVLQIVIIIIINILKDGVVYIHLGALIFVHFCTIHSLVLVARTIICVQQYAYYFIVNSVKLFETFFRHDMKGIVSNVMVIIFLTSRFWVVSTI